MIKSNLLAAQNSLIQKKFVRPIQKISIIYKLSKIVRTARRIKKSLYKSKDEVKMHSTSLISHKVKKMRDKQINCDVIHVKLVSTR